MTILDSNGVYGADTSSPMLAPKGIVGRTDGVAPSIGNIGYSASTAVPLANGSYYISESTTAITNTGLTETVSETLNRGKYLISFYLHANKAASANSDRILFKIAIGGNTDTKEYTSISSILTGAFLVVSVTVPVLITADGTKVAMMAQSGAEVATSPKSRMATLVIA